MENIVQLSWLDPNVYDIKNDLDVIFDWLDKNVSQGIYPPYSHDTYYYGYSRAYWDFRQDFISPPNEILANSTKWKISIEQHSFAIQDTNNKLVGEIKINFIFDDGSDAILFKLKFVNTN